MGILIKVPGYLGTSKLELTRGTLRAALMSELSTNFWLYYEFASLFSIEINNILKLFG
jgi:hypothetical protein